MSISNYSELQAAVAGWLHRADLVAIIPDLITIGESRIFREVRVRVMESAFTGTIVNGVVALPTGYRSLKFAYISSTPNSLLSRNSAQQVYAKWPSRVPAGKPVAIAREGTNFIFGPYPDSNYSVAGIYYQAPTVISSTPNALFLANPDLYLFAALCEAAPYIQDDPRIQLWEGKYASIKQQMSFEDNEESGGGSGLAVRAA